jgi:hypothetical protein
MLRIYRKSRRFRLIGPMRPVRPVPPSPSTRPSNPAGRLFLLLFLLSPFLFSCATIPPANPVEGWLAVLPPLERDSLYASVDVASSWSVVQSLGQATGAETEVLGRVVDRVERVHARIRLVPQPSSVRSPELSLIAVGSLPAGAVARRLDADPVWDRVMLEPLPGGGYTGTHWSFRTYWQADRLQIAVPRRGLLFLAFGAAPGDERAGAAGMLQRLHSPEAQRLPAQAAAAATTADVFIYIPAPAALASGGEAGALLQNIPISRGWMDARRYTSPEGTEGYQLQIVFLLSRAESARSVEMLLRLMVTLWLRKLQVEDPVQILKAVRFSSDSESARIQGLFLETGEIASFLQTLVPEGFDGSGRP